MSEARELPRRIVVAGDGPLGVLAAVALKRALPPTDVVIIGTPPDPAALAERSPTALPFAGPLHEKNGVTDEELIRRCGASHRLVTRYLGWRAREDDGVAAYGAEVDPRLNTGFARSWGTGPRNASSPGPPGSLAEVLAAAGRYAAPDATPTPLAAVDAALRWNVPAYRDLLVGRAEQLAVRHVRGAIQAVEPDGEGGAAAVGVENAGSIPADLFVDCSGPRATILSRLADARWIDWQACLPVREVLIAKPDQPMLALEDRITLTAAGWRWEVAGRDGRAAMIGIGEAHDAETAARELDGEPAGLVRLSPGRAAEPWIGNVVALGDAAARLEPLGGFALDLAHRQLDLLLELLPGRTVHPLERREFNRRAGLMADRTRDVLAAHYAAPMAHEIYGDVAFPDELVRALDQFTRRGRLPFFEEAPLLTQELTGLLNALGLPAGEGALTRAGGAAQAEARARAFAATAEAALRSVPPYGEWMRRVLAS